MDFPESFGDRLVTGAWVFAGSESEFRLNPLPAKRGTYTFSSANPPLGNVLLADEQGGSIIRFDDFMYPPSSGLGGQGVLLFAKRKGTVLDWYVT